MLPARCVVGCLVDRSIQKRGSGCEDVIGIHRPTSAVGQRSMLVVGSLGVVSGFEWIFEQATAHAIGRFQQLTKPRANSARARRMLRVMQHHFYPFQPPTKENNVATFDGLLVFVAGSDGCLTAGVAASSSCPWPTRNRAPSDPKEVLPCRPNPAVGRRRLGQSPSV